VNGANWTPDGAKQFAIAVKERLGARPLVVSSFGYLVTRGPEIMAAMDGIADFFAPQVYWFRNPTPSMVPAEDPALGGLRTDDAAAYAKVCLHHWRQIVTKPLVITAQAYWGEAEDWTQARAERKLEEFLAGFDDYGALAGLNWWNLADPSAMSARMRSLIAGARLGGRFESAAGRGGRAGGSPRVGGSGGLPPGL
jgi:hypothetical protein